MTTLQSIQARIAKLQAQAESLATTKSSAVLEKIRGLMDKHAVTVADIEAFIGKRRGRKPGKTVAAKQGPSAAKYRNPKTGATWSGHGRAPAWIANAKDRTRFLIAGAAPKSAAVAVRAPKAGNYVRGPQPPKYRDPKTGATWSGRGIAPAWLAGAKDRSKFLIEKAEPAAKAAKGPAAKKTAAKKNTVKKSTATRKAAVEKVSVKAVASPARKAAPKNGAAAKSSVVRKARAPKLAVQSAPVDVAAPSAATEVASTAASA